ncbi:septum formation protein [Desulfonatronum thiosulfatophilum]|uniref:dTTP/UTP pyrophosphatase n=1 Tax=Desulfonatronum thiosulfatophilum TaxID=617002 RepID=A0A1G6EG57_9BACT|nr:Maf family protein [Desulfonatronum thiosulfatophilum]SDB56376.1 septum formation protein [Desulfonatronum thiosulfatophilum]
MFQTTSPLVLGSGSPRRRELLEGLGILFAVHPAVDPEPEFVTGSCPEEHALDAARRKAREVAVAYPEAMVLAADTIVVVDGDVLGKPENAAVALEMLQRLAGREHAVITGCCLRMHAKGYEQGFAVRTRVWMRDFGKDVLTAYAATGEPLDKAGAYGIQDRAGFLVERIEGSYTNVVGLPLAETIKLLLEQDIIKARCHETYVVWR